MIRALGCMRLSTVAARDDVRAAAVLVSAIDHGVTLLDTADAYAHDDADRGHNERLVAAACAARPTAPVRIVTKGGLVRPGGRWQPDGRATISPNVMRRAVVPAASASSLRLTKVWLSRAATPVTAAPMTVRVPQKSNG